MKNKILLNMGSIAIAFGCIFTCSNFTFNAKAYENVLSVPQQGLELRKCLMNKSNDGICLNGVSAWIIPTITKLDNAFKIEFYSADPGDGFNPQLDPPAAGNSYFVVFKDHITKKILAMKPLNLNNEEKYEVICEVSSNIDIVDVEIYSQSSAADKYYPESATFIGQMRLFTAADFIYLRQANTQVEIKAYDENGAEVPADEPLFYNRLTPNLFSIYSPTDFNGWIYKIEPDSGNMAEEDKVGISSYFKNYLPSTATPLTGSQVIQETADRTFYNFYILEDVTSFTVKCYRNGSISQANLAKQYKVKLNRN